MTRARPQARRGAGHRREPARRPTAVSRLADELVRDDDPLHDELAAWLASSRRFRAFVEAHREKIRKKVTYRISRSGKLIRRVRWVKRKVTVGVDVTAGVPNRAWGHHHDLFCGVDIGGQPCERPYEERPPGDFVDQVTIGNFLYLPGDRSLGGDQGNPPRIHHGQSLRFVNADQTADIRHTVTTCAWPCVGTYVANYPFPDGAWDSGTLGFDAIDGGSPDPVSSTPPDLAVGKYSYFCRIHPWMRGAFEVVP